MVFKLNQYIYIKTVMPVGRGGVKIVAINIDVKTVMPVGSGGV